MWRKNRDPYPVEISDEGYVVANYLPPEDGGMPGDFVLYTPMGKEVERYKNPYGKGAGMGGALAKFTEDGEYAMMCFRNARQDKSTIILASKNGQTLWKKEFSYRGFRVKEEVVGISNIGIFGIFDKYGRDRQTYAYFIDWGGNLRWSIPLNIRGNMIIKVYSDRKKAIISSTEGYIWCIDVKLGKLLWKHKESWAPNPTSRRWPDNVPLFYKMELTGDHVYIKGHYESRHIPYRGWYKSAIFIFNANNGVLIQKTEYPDKQIFLHSYKEKIFILDRSSKSIHSLEVKP